MEVDKLYLKYIVTASDNGHRAVDVLCKRTGMSRMMSKKIRLHGSLTKNGQHCRMIDPVEAGDLLEAKYHPKGNDIAPLRKDPSLPVLYHDDWLIVVNKPSNMVTHPTYLHDKGSATDRLADYPLHPVTRLDRDTTGTLLIALNGHAHHVITSNKMDKTYLALVHGKIPEKKGSIMLPIGRDPDSIMLRRIDDNGLAAHTNWEVRRYFASCDVSLVSFKLITGRTHQIRLHSQSIGHPLLGDWLYGLAEKDPSTLTEKQILAESLFQRQALHAFSLSFVHPGSLKIQTVKAPLTSDFRKALYFLQKYNSN